MGSNTMDTAYYRALLYYVTPFIIISSTFYILYLLLSTALGWYIIPVCTAFAAWYKYGRNQLTKIKNGERYNTIVVGAGFSGLCTGAKLLEAGIPFTIFEAASDVGGTWHQNTYPGCACDVWSSLYQFTFFQNPDWSRFVAPANEIKSYLVRFAKEYDLYKYIQFNTRVISAVWKEEEGAWKVVTNKGTLKCRILVSASGALHKPLHPSIDGIQDFKGPSFHSANWNHDVSLIGKKVGIVG